MPPHLISATKYGVFLFSGMCGLGYQMVWSRMFAIGLGHEMPSLLAVVMAFFAGLAIGASIILDWLLLMVTAPIPRFICDSADAGASTSAGDWAAKIWLQPGWS